MTRATQQSRVDFVRDLTAAQPSLVVWKHLDRALTGRGDIDAAAPQQDIPTIARDADIVAGRAFGATHAIRCNHQPNLHMQFFVQPDRMPDLFQFDIFHHPSRGAATWADPRAMLELSTIRPDGIRALRPGAEAVGLTVLNGISLRGHERLSADDRATVNAGLAADLVGAYRACAIFAPKPARRALLALTQNLAHGVWSRTHASAAFAGFCAGSVSHPWFAARQAASRARHVLGRDCMMAGLNRRVPTGSVDDFLHAARRSGHEVTAL